MLRYLLPILICVIQIFAVDLSSVKYSEKEYKSIIEEIRLTYYAGVENDEYIDSLKHIIVQNFGENHSEYPSIVNAYRAGIFALKSKHAFWPFNKMSYLNDSMELFEQVITSEPENLEIRFMRFSILYYVPGILGYDKEEDADLKKVFKLLLQRNYSDVSKEIQLGMINFLLETELLSEQDELKLKSLSTLATSDE